MPRPVALLAPLLESLEDRRVMTAGAAPPPEPPAALLAPAPDEGADVELPPVEHSVRVQAVDGVFSGGLWGLEAQPVLRPGDLLVTLAQPGSQAAPPVDSVWNGGVGLVAYPEVEATGQVPAMAGSPESVAPAAQAPKVAVAASLVLPTADGTPTLRLQQPAAAAGPVEVRCVVTAFGPGVAHQEQVVSVPAGGKAVEVALQPVAGTTEIVTVQLHATSGDAAPAVTTEFLTSDPSACSEAALFEAYRQGQSPEAFAALVDRYRQTVMRTCHRVVGNWHDAEDLCQIVFLALAHRQLGLQTSLAGWLRTVARNAAIVFLRAKNRRARHEGQAAKEVQVPSDEAAHDQREELDLALQQLHAPLREAVRLRYLEGWSQNEAAALLGCPRGTLSQRAALGVRHLRGILGDGEDGATL